MTGEPGTDGGRPFFLLLSVCVRLKVRTDLRVICCRGTTDSFSTDQSRNVSRNSHKSSCLLPDLIILPYFPLQHSNAEGA